MFWGCHSRAAEDSTLLGCDNAVVPGVWKEHSTCTLKVRQYKNWTAWPLRQRFNNPLKHRKLRTQTIPEEWNLWILAAVHYVEDYWFAGPCPVSSMASRTQHFADCPGCCLELKLGEGQWIQWLKLTHPIWQVTVLPQAQLCVKLKISSGYYIVCMLVLMQAWQGVLLKVIQVPWTHTVCVCVCIYTVYTGRHKVYIDITNNSRPQTYNSRRILVYVVEHHKSVILPHTGEDWLIYGGRFM
jgi:hypothetical protein